MLVILVYLLIHQLVQVDLIQEHSLNMDGNIGLLSNPIIYLNLS